jgi:SAM-dependent methyltransferase
MDSALFRLHAEVELAHWWFVARREIMRAVLATAVPPHEGRLVVDVGCGTGANIAALAGEYDVLGVDDSAEGIELARQRFAGVEFVRGLAPDDVEGRLGTAAAVLMMDVLEHVPDDTGVLGPIVEAAPPGAVFLLTVPAGMHLWTEHDDHFGHYRRYDEAGFRAIWSSLPVETIMVSHYNTRLYPVVRAVRMLTRLRGRSWGKAGSDLDLPSRPVNAVLRRAFAGEASRLVALARGERTRPYRRGVSLIALLRRKPT